MIDTRELGKSYEGRTALECLSLHVAAGETYGLLGPMGAGRSTLINILAAVVQPSAGEGRVAGFSLLDDPAEIRTRVGLWPGFAATYEDLRVREYLEFFALAYRVSRNRLGEIVPRLLELANLADHAEDYVDALDPEQRQRLGLVKTLVHDPPVLLLDEPALGFAPEVRARLRALLLQFRALGKTMMVSSNLVGDLAGLCDRIGILHRGRLILEGPAAEVLHRLSGERLIELQVSGETAILCPAIAAHPGVREAVPHGAGVVFAMEDAAADPAAIIAELAGAGLPLAAWREHEIQPEGLLERLRVRAG